MKKPARDVSASETDDSQTIQRSLPVFYNEAQSVQHNASSSPSAGKPKLLVEYCLQREIAIQVVSSFDPLRPADFYLAHSKKYVDDVLSAKVPNGFGNRSPQIAKSLPWTSGSLYAAARHAISKQTITAAPVSGFHHSGYDYGGAYCSLNALCVVPQLLKKHGYANRVGIIDVDAHFP